jgi:DNA repair exonuclease SbcCD nuclease subunit
LKFVHTADTHLGFEITRTAQSDPEGRRRRSDAIFRNFLKVLQHAVNIEADLLIHSGDLFNKYHISRDILDKLIRPILDHAKVGMPILVIPGNHERSEFPFDLFQGASGIYVFDRPKSLLLNLNGYAVGIAGFPFIRNDSRRMFPEALRQTEYGDLRSDFNILITHQAFDRARVGPEDFTFRPGRPDTVSRHTVPVDFEYIAAGHVHRSQILPHPAKPGLNFVYPGAIQRMSFAEMYEDKGFVEGEVLNGRIETRFIPLPVYEMEIVEIDASGLTARACEKAIMDQSWRFDEDRVIRFNLIGGKKRGDYPDMDFDTLRSKMPPVLECQFALRAGKNWILR